jgi:NNP family nitrate/nitrite transporter-like MFS transporter
MIPREEEGLRQHERWWRLAHTVIVNFLLGGFGFCYIVWVVAELLEDLAIGIREWGVLWSGISFGVLLSSISGGALGDRFGVRRLVTIGLVISGGALVLRAAAGQFLTMLFCMILFGIGLGIVSANVPKALGTWFPPDRLGLANGVALAGVGAGQASAALLTGPLVERVGSWRTLTLLLGFVLLSLALYWWLVVREVGPKSPERSPAPRAWPAILRVLRVGEVWILALCYLLFLGGLFGVIGYLPTYLTTARGLSQESAAIVVSLAPWTYVVGSALLPALSDRVGLRRTVYSAAIIASAAFVMGHAYLAGFALALSSALLGLSAGAVAILFVVPVELDRVGPRLAGTALGVIVSAGSLGGAVVPAFGMWLARTRTVTGLVFFSAAFLLSALTFTLIRESRPRNGARST